MLIKPSKVSLFDHRAEPGWNKSFYLDLKQSKWHQWLQCLKTRLVDLIRQLLPNLYVRKRSHFTCVYINKRIM